MGPSTGEPDPLPTIHSGSSVVVPLFLVEPSTYMRIKKTQVYHTYQIQLGMQVIDLPYNRRGPVRAVVAYPGSQTPFPSFPLVGRLPAGMPVGASRSRACRATAALPNSPSAVSDVGPHPQHTFTCSVPAFGPAWKVAPRWVAAAAHGGGRSLHPHHCVERTSLVYCPNTAQNG